ncbi:MAG: twin-arginine translocase subunit TatC [Bryobacteraceae bacterium]
MADEYGDERFEPNGDGASWDDPNTEEPVTEGAYDALEPSSALSTETAAVSTTTAVLPAKHAPPPPPPPPPPTDDEDGEGDEERGMLRMSFMEHLGELRSRIIRALGGLLVAFLVCMFFSKPLWIAVQAPASDALKHLGYPPNLVAISPMEQFNIIWMKMPLLLSLFVGAPWVLYQIWAFISPGLYRREKKWAVPFIASTAGLFIAGGLFAYFIVFRYCLEFLLGIGRGIGITPMISMRYYFDLFVNVTLGVALVFEMPVLIFFLTLLHIASPRFLLKNSRYAILAIAVIAAVVTPTPDVFNMMIFALPMILLFFVGVFLSYLLVLKREGRQFPWTPILLGTFGTLLAIAIAIAIMIYQYHYHFIAHWPYLAR